MKTSDLIVPVIEPVAKRYERTWLKLKDDRKVRGFDYQAEERRSREFVDPATVEVTKTVGTAAPKTGQVATDVAVTGTVTERFDNTPSGFAAETFEEALVDNPNDATGGPEEDPTP